MQYGSQHESLHDQPQVVVLRHRWGDTESGVYVFPGHIRVVCIQTFQKGFCVTDLTLLYKKYHGYHVKLYPKNFS